MIFDEQTLEQLHRQHWRVFFECQTLQQRYLSRQYRDPRTYEFVRYGFCRRLKTLTRCIENVFEILPPSRVELPSIEECTDAGINIQAFVFNTFGAIDNLAWIYVHESGLTRQGGAALRRTDVGLRENNQLVRQALSAGFREYLGEIEQWFQNLESFRHALAHRIPLYVPPYIVPDDRLDEYHDFEQQMNEAARAENFQEYERLRRERDSLGYFAPVMTHSFDEEAPQVIFHPQMLNDFGTVEEIAERMLQEIDR